MIADTKIDYRHCNGCGICYRICPMDVFGWDEEKGLPILAYPDECWHCGACELDCPEMAIDVEIPFHQKFFFGIDPAKPR